MTLATRTRHQVNSHASWDIDMTRVAAHYAVDGTDKVLVQALWIPHEWAEDADAIDSTLAILDHHAQEAAAMRVGGR